MKKNLPDDIFAKYAPRYKARHYAPTPIERGKKRPLLKNWTAAGRASMQEIEALGKKFPDANIGLLAGIKLPNGRLFAFIDIDDPRLVPFVCAVVPAISSKVGVKGLTNFYQTVPGLKSMKFRAPGASAPAVEIFTTTGQTVVPPSIHPTGKQYRWVGRSLLDIESHELTLLDSSSYAILQTVLKNKNAWEIINGGPDVKAHEFVLRLTSSGVANLTEDHDALADALNELFDPGYVGNTKDETRGMLESARKKGLGSSCQST